MRSRPAQTAAVGAALASLLAGTAHAAPPTVAGEVRALAVSGEALVVARTLPRHRLVVERRAPGKRPRTLLRTSDRALARSSIAIAASPQAVAIATDDDQYPGGSRVLVGPADGPLREVARCDRSFLASPVAVTGSRITWQEGGCGPSAGRFVEVSQASLAVGDADPRVAVRRIALPEDRLAASVVALGDGGLVGLYRPAFVGFIASEVRALGPDGLGAVVLRRPGLIELPVGIPDGGPPVVSSEAVDADDEDDSEDGVCRMTVLAVPAGQPPRPIALGGCLARDSDGALEVARDRVLARLALRARRTDRGRFERSAITSVRANGSDRRTVVRGTFRGPGMLAAGGGHVAWTQPHCPGGTELASAPVVPATVRPRAVRSCTIEPLTGRARVRRGAIAVRVRCPLGCATAVVDDSRCGSRFLRSFHLEPGTHTVHVRLGRRLRRAHRVLLRFRVEHGPQRFRAIRLRR